MPCQKSYACAPAILSPSSEPASLALRGISRPKKWWQLSKPEADSLLDQDSCTGREARFGGGMVTCGQQGKRVTKGRLEGPRDPQACQAPPHQVSDDIIALFLQPHKDAGGIQATTVGQNHGALAGHLVWRSMKECECCVSGQPCKVPPGSGPSRGGLGQLIP